MWLVKSGQLLNRIRERQSRVRAGSYVGFGLNARPRYAVTFRSSHEAIEDKRQHTLFQHRAHLFRRYRAGVHDRAADFLHAIADDLAGFVSHISDFSVGCHAKQFTAVCGPSALLVNMIAARICSAYRRLAGKLVPASAHHVLNDVGDRLLVAGIAVS